LKLDVHKLTKEITALENYMPLIEDDEGLKYLYDTLFLPMQNDSQIRICDIDFDEFSLEDVGEFEDYFDQIILKDEWSANTLAVNLRILPPITTKTCFI
jgi:hypothetical protein